VITGAPTGNHSIITGYEKKIEGATSGLLIGDRALQLRSQFEFAMI